MAKLTDKSLLTTPANDDLLHIVDISDVTSSPDGTSKKITRSDLLGTDANFTSGTVDNVSISNSTIINPDIDGGTVDNVSISNSTIINPDIDGGTVDGVTIGDINPINEISQAYGKATQTMLLHLEDIFNDFVVFGCLPATSLTLTSDISAGVAYSQGRRIVTTTTSHTYTTSTDTYVDLKGDGTYVFTEVTNNAVEPVIATDSIRLAKVVTDTNNIIIVTDMRYMNLKFVQTIDVFKSKGINDQASTTAIMIDVNEFVGIGTTNPITTLDVNGEIAVKSGSSFNKAMSGDLQLVCSPTTAGTSAATLNAAAAGTFTQTVTITLEDAAALVHKWSSNTLSVVCSVTVADTDILAPALSDVTPNLIGGTINVTLTYDTDAGATKTYTAGDIVTLTVSSANILGYPIMDVTFIDTLVA